MNKITKNYISVLEGHKYSTVTMIDKNTLILSNIKENVSFKLTSDKRNEWRYLLANTYSVKQIGNKVILPKEILSNIDFTEYDTYFTENGSLVIKGLEKSFKL